MSKVIGIHQPQYLPWLGLIERVSRCDLFVILDNVPYSKNYFYNRNRIKAANGSVWLTVPILTKGHFGQSFLETKIDNAQKWGAKHWKGIQLSYGTAPFFRQYQEYFQMLYERKWELLVDLCIETFLFLLRSYNITTELVRASELSVEGKKEDLLISICRKTGATHYLSGLDGKNYLTEDEWEKNNIAVDFQQYLHPVYPQLFGTFVPNLSAIDLLFNCGAQATSILTSVQPQYFMHE